MTRRVHVSSNSTNTRAERNRFQRNSHFLGMSRSSVSLERVRLMPSGLCSVCDTIFRGSPKEGEHHKSADDMVAASRQGCYICRTVTNTRAWTSPGVLSSRSGFKWSLYNEDPGDMTGFIETDDEAQVWPFHLVAKANMPSGLFHTQTIARH